MCTDNWPGKPVPLMLLLCLILAGLQCAGCSNPAATYVSKEFERYGRNFEELPMHTVITGDPEQEVVRKLGMPARVLWERTYTDGSTVEAWEYEKWGRTSFEKDFVERRYWVYIKDGFVSSWERGYTSEDLR